MNPITKLVVVLAYLLSGASVPADRLVLVSASYGKNVVAICDAEGQTLWSHHTAGPTQGHAGHHDVQLLPDGNILYHDSWTRVTEMTLDKQVVWTYDSSTMNGNQGQHVEVHAFSRLPDGLTMIAESGVGRVIEVNRSGEVVRRFALKQGGTQFTRHVRITPHNTYLVCSEDPGVVIEYNRSGEIVWDYQINTRVYGAIRLRSGNTLIASGNGHSVVEVTPDKKVVWEIKGNVPGTEVELNWTTCLQERPNGNFIIGNCHAGPNNPQILEVDRDKKIVWQFDQYALVGNGLACWQVLDHDQSILVRQLLARLEK